MIKRTGTFTVPLKTAGALGRLVLAGLALGLQPSNGRAGQITLDHSLGQSGQSLTGPNFDITANNGLIKGNNLFFSFSQFDLSGGETATFSGPNNIQNILSRITGNLPSSIDGTISSSISGANVFLINPKGIVFGPDAQLNVSGSFAASTANYLKLADGAKFVAALDADDSGLSTAAVSAFGFLGTQPGSIQLQQSILAVPNGQTLSLVGGDVLLDGAKLQAPAGNVTVVSVKSAGEVPVDPAAVSPAEFNAAFPQQGDVTLQNGALIDASGDGGGRIVIRGGLLTVDNSIIQANTTGTGDGQGIDISVLGDLNLSNGGQIDSLSPAGLGAGGNINLTAQSITLDGGGAVDANNNITTQITTATGDSVYGSGGGPAKGGDIVINTGSLQLVDSAQISSASWGAGNAGNIDITASSVVVDALLTSTTQIIANSQLNYGGGRAGDITIHSASVDLKNGAVIAAATFGDGDAGTIDITAQTLNFANSAGIAVSTFGSGKGGSVQIAAETVTLDSSAFINAITTGSFFFLPDQGQGGTITINANSLSLLNGSRIFSQTAGDGNSGDINITSQTISIAGGSGILASDGDPLYGFGLGNGGNIILNAGSLELSGGGQIISSTLGTGNAGTVAITAGSVSLQGASSIQSAAAGNEIDGFFASGQAGGVSLSLSGGLSLSGQSFISVSTINSGSAGTIGITAAGINLQGASSIESASTGTGLADGLVGGLAGDITLDLKNALSMSGQSVVSVSTASSGNAGKVNVTANSVTLDGASSIESASTGSALANGYLGGQAGGVALNLGGTLSLSGSSRLSVSSVENDAGDVSVAAGDSIRLTDSQINAQAGLNGGNISLTAPSLIYLLHSPLTANAENGNGGVITLDPSIVVLNQSPLTAKVSVQGNGGTVTIGSDYFFASQSPFDVSTPSGIPGTVVVTAPNIDLSGVLVALQGNFLDAESQLRPDCGVRLAGNVSSFITLGLGGLPPAPGGFVPSSLPTVPRGADDR